MSNEVKKSPKPTDFQNLRQGKNSDIQVPLECQSHQILEIYDKTQAQKQIQAQRKRKMLKSNWIKIDF